jgi:hypothetical protein
MKISFPTQITYFICKNDKNITGYGEITPEQEMTTGQPIVDTYLDKGQWEAKLLEGGITLEQENLEQ